MLASAPWLVNTRRGGDRTSLPVSRATPLAEPVDIDAVRNLDVVAATARLGPGYGPALGRLPMGLQVFRGLPFALGPTAGDQPLSSAN